MGHIMLATSIETLGRPPTIRADVLKLSRIYTDTRACFNYLRVEIIGPWPGQEHVKRLLSTSAASLRDEEFTIVVIFAALLF